MRIAKRGFRAVLLGMATGLYAYTVTVLTDDTTALIVCGIVGSIMLNYVWYRI